MDGIDHILIDKSRINTESVNIRQIIKITVRHIKHIPGLYLRINMFYTLKCLVIHGCDNAFVNIIILFYECCNHFHKIRLVVRKFYLYVKPYFSLGIFHYIRQKRYAAFLKFFVAAKPASGIQFRYILIIHIPDFLIHSGRSLKAVIMHDHNPSVLRLMDIKFNIICRSFHCFLKCKHGILRCIV